MCEQEVRILPAKVNSALNTTTAAAAVLSILPLLSQSSSLQLASLT